MDDEPKVVKPVLGVGLRMPQALLAAERAIVERAAEAHDLPTRRLRPERTGVGFSMVIDREAFELRLHRGEELLRTFDVGVGTASHPTPAGRFRIANVERHPTWRPPDSRWAEGIGPVPPGPDNPLGTRRIGISAPGDRHPRHAAARHRRPPVLPRLRPDADPARRVALQRGAARDGGEDRLTRRQRRTTRPASARRTRSDAGRPYGSGSGGRRRSATSGQQAAREAATSSTIAARNANTRNAATAPSDP